VGQDIFEFSPPPAENPDFILSERWCGPAQLILGKDLHDLTGNGRSSLKGFMNTPGNRHMSA